MKATEMFYSALRKLANNDTGSRWLSMFVTLWLDPRGNVTCWCAENESVRTWDFMFDYPSDVDKFLQHVHDAKAWNRTHDQASIYRVTVVK